ncbi:MAG: hypothetical protein ACK56I_01610, partial [bacterium]
EALFTAVYETYGLIDILHDKRQLIKDEMQAISQILPYPSEKGRLLLHRLGLLNMEINDLEDKALDLNRVAMMGLLRSSDVTNATKALKCIIGKSKLALDKLVQFENFMAVTTSFLQFIAKVSAAAASAPIGYLQIANLIKDLNSVINMELADTLSPEEIKTILLDIRVDCARIT